MRSTRVAVVYQYRSGTLQYISPVYYVVRCAMSCTEFSVLAHPRNAGAQAKRLADVCPSTRPLVSYRRTKRIGDGATETRECSKRVHPTPSPGVVLNQYR